MEVMDFTSRDDQDEIWGKVIDVVDDDFMWAGNRFDDFSTSDYEKSFSDRIIPTVVNKKVVTMSRKTNVSTTPCTSCKTVLTPPLSNTPGSKVKKLKCKLSEMTVEAAASRPHVKLQRERRPSNDLPEEWTVPLEITTTNEDPRLSLNTEVTSGSPSVDEKFFIKSVGGLGMGRFFDNEDADELDDRFVGAMSHKFNKSLGDLPSNHLEDLMHSSLDYLKSLETKIDQNKNVQIWKSGSMGRGAEEIGPPHASITSENENEVVSPRNVGSAEVVEDRPNNSSRNKTDSSPPQSRDRRSRSVDHKKEKYRKDRFQSGDAARRDTGKNRSSCGDRNSRKANKSLAKSRREGRTVKSAPKTDDRTRRERLSHRSRSNSTKHSSRSIVRDFQTPGQSRRSASPRSRSNSPRRGRRSSSRSVRKDDRTNDGHSRHLYRSRSVGLVNPTCSSDGKKKDKERSSRQDCATGRSRNKSRPPSESMSPTKINNTQRRGADKRSAPARSKSEDLMDLLGASLGDLVKLGIRFDPLLTSGLESTVDDKSPLKKRPQVKRTKSMVADPQKEMQRRDLRNGLRRVDKTSERSSSKRNEELKSTGGASSTTSSTKRSSGSSRGSTVSDAEQAERLLKEQAKLAREQRRAEEAKLKRLQEEARLLEEKTRSEEMRLMVLKEEAKIWEARMDKEAHVKEEAEIAHEKTVMSDQERGEQEGIEKTNDQNSQESRKNQWKVEAISESEQESKSLSVGSQEDMANQKHSLSQTTKRKFGGSPKNIEQLPPAFQVLHEQSKQKEK